MLPTRRRIRFGFICALALSVALHAGLAPLVRVARASDERSRQGPPLTMTITPPRVAPSPTPRPRATPPPVPPPRKPSEPPPIVRASAAAHAPRVPHVPNASEHAPHSIAAGQKPGDTARAGASRDGGTPPGDGGVGDGSNAPAGAPDAAPPSPSPTPKPACDRPDVDARVVVPVEPEMPEIARERQASGTVAVRVDLSDTGAVESASVAQSSDPAFDAAALDAARRSTYAPAITACRARGGSYLFRAEFDG